MNVLKTTAVCLSGLFLVSCSNDKNIPDSIISEKIGTKVIDGASCSFYTIRNDADSNGYNRAAVSADEKLGTAMICKNDSGTSTTLKSPDGPKGQVGNTTMRYEAK